MKRKLILASASPRRQELLKLCKRDFSVEVSNSDEIINLNLPIGMAIEEVALAKALAVFAKHPQDLVLGCDTVVVIDNEILGKPKDSTEAYQMISKLSGRTHKVITGVAFVSADEKEVFHSVAEVTFAKMSEKEIKDYIALDEPYDKAGGYALQGAAAIYIESIKGDYYTIVGLPVQQVYQYLKGKR